MLRDGRILGSIRDSDKQHVLRQNNALRSNCCKQKGFATRDPFSHQPKQAIHSLLVATTALVAVAQHKVDTFRNTATRNSRNMNALRCLTRTKIGIVERSLLSTASKFRCRFLSSSSSESKSSDCHHLAAAGTSSAIVEESMAPAATTATTSSGNDVPPNRLLEKSGLLEVCRHGTGDAVILLNVGGKEFSTLRSTVASNQVLAEYVARAEANQEFICGSAAVFVDRDPTYFPLILNHLRNKVEGLSYSSSAKKRAIANHTKYNPMEYHVQLPKDLNALRDIYVEATHYRIPELEEASCKQNFMVTLLGAFGGGSNKNPFDQANRLFQIARRGLVAAGSVGTVAFTTQQDINMTKIGAVLFPAWISESKEETTSSESKSNGSTTGEPAAA